MNPEERKLLEETWEFARKSHEILRSMRRSMMWGRVFRVIYWIIILAVAVGSYYYFQPYIDQFAKLFGSLAKNIDAVNKIFNSAPR